MKTDRIINPLEPFYIEDFDTPEFTNLRKTLVTNKYMLKPLENKHFLDLFEFRLQNEPLESDPFDKLGEKFEEAYTNFFTYNSCIDNVAWILYDRLYVVGFFLLELEVDYNDYLNRSAHLYYEMWNNIKDPSLHAECIKSIRDCLFDSSDIPLLELHIDDDDGDIICRQALEKLNFTRDPKKDPDIGYRYYTLNDDPLISQPPRHMPFILKAYRDMRESHPN